MTASPDTTIAASSNSPALKLAALVGVVYVACALWMPERGFWIYDTSLKFLQVRAIADHGQLALDWAGRALDPSLDFGPIRWGFYALVGDELHAAYSPVFPLLTAPFYKLLGDRGLLVLPLCGALFGLVAVWRLAGLVAGDVPARSRVQIAAVLVTAFATPLWFYAVAFWEHAPAAALSCWCVWALLVYRPGPSVGGAARVGALAALPIYFRPENYLFAAVLLSLAAWDARRRLPEVLALAAGLIIALAPLWLFHTLALGHPLGLHITNQRWEDLSFAGYVADRAQVAMRLLVNLHAHPGWSFAAAVPFYAAMLTGFALRKRLPDWVFPVAAAAGVASACIVAIGLLQAPRPMNWLIAANGLFAGSPLLVLAFLGERDDSRATEARRSLLVVSLAYAVLYAVFIPDVNSKGIHWGCRFLLPVYPLLAVASVVNAVRWWDRLRPNPLRASPLVLLVGVSVLLQLYSVKMIHDRKAYTVALNERVAATEAEAVIADPWFLPVDLVDSFADKPVFFGPLQRREQLLSRLTDAGVKSILFVDGGEKAGPGDESMHDGWLRFSPVTLATRRLPLVETR